MKAGGKCTVLLLVLAMLCSGAVLLWKHEKKREEPPHPAGIWEIEFKYEKRSSGELLHALVGSVSENGAEATIRKRNGRANDPKTVEVIGTYSMDSKQLEELTYLLRKYPVEEIMNAPRRHSFGGNIGLELRIRDGDKNLYIGNLNAFPDSLPPMRELLYTELYNFFNAFVSADEKMKSVWTEQLPDPAADPKYGARTVLHFGKEVSLVPGTGYGDNYGDEIDYGDRKWWIEEGYVGSYIMTEEDKMLKMITEDSASFIIREDGSFELTLDGTLYTGNFGTTRYYKQSPGGRYEKSAPGAKDDQAFSFDFNGEISDESLDDTDILTEEEETKQLKAHIYLECHSEPHPFVRNPRYVEMTRVE